MRASLQTIELVNLYANVGHDPLRVAVDILDVLETWAQLHEIWVYVDDVRSDNLKQLLKMRNYESRDEGASWAKRPFIDV